MASFAELTQVEPIDSHSYRINLGPEWCIGSVPNGGAVTSCILAVTKKHFLTTLAAQAQPDALILHLDFVQRTSAGPAVVRVEDLKLGRQTSTVRVTLTQAGRDEIVGSVTHIDLARETGLTLPTAWALHPSPPAPPADFDVLRSRGADGAWRAWTTPRPDFRKASTNVDIFIPRNNSGDGDGDDDDAAGGRTARGVQDQWMRLASGERFDNVSLGLVADMFPQLAESYAGDAEALAAAGVTSRKQLLGHWYPTLALNLDVKKPLPERGVEWLFVRTQAKALRNGRKDLEVVVLDQAGDLVALSHHVVMILSSARNLAKRGEGKAAAGAADKGKL